jgi:hypothetical protein
MSIAVPPLKAQCQIRSSFSYGMSFILQRYSKSGYGHLIFLEICAARIQKSSTFADTKKEKKWITLI